MSVATEKKYLLWLNRHNRELSKHAGHWVGIKLGKGIVASGKSLKQVRQSFLRRYPNDQPHLLQVPPKGEKFYILVLS